MWARALCGGPREPARVAVETSMAATAIRLGWVPSVEEPTPIEWHPLHLWGELREDVLVEHWYLTRLRLGLRAYSTVAGVGGSTALDPELF